MDLKPCGLSNAKERGMIRDVTSEIQEVEPIWGLIYEAFGAAEAGDFYECLCALEGLRQLSA